jgi:uncharacterized protein YhfF
MPNETGRPIVTDPDPTANVTALVLAEKERNNDLRQLEGAYRDRLDFAERERATAERLHVRELMELQARHSWDMRDAESKRIDAIRLVDTGNVTRAAEVSSAQAAALATSVIQSAEALRVQVEATRITTQDQLETALGPIRTQVESLRVTQFQQQGEKSAQAEGTGDDRFARVYQQSQEQFVAALKQQQNYQAQQQEQFVETIKLNRTSTSNSSAGIRIAAIVGAASTLILLLSFMITLFAAHIL